MSKNINKGQNYNQLNFIYVQISFKTDNIIILHLTLHKDIYQTFKQYKFTNESIRFKIWL